MLFSGAAAGNTDDLRLRTAVCVDCGWVYTDATPFEDQPESYRCPQCQAPKRRFVPYDKRTGQVGA